MRFIFCMMLLFVACKDTSTTTSKQQKKVAAATTNQQGDRLVIERQNAITSENALIIQVLYSYKQKNSDEFQRLLPPKNIAVEFLRKTKAEFDEEQAKDSALVDQYYVAYKSSAKTGFDRYSGAINGNQFKWDNAQLVSSTLNEAANAFSFVVTDGLKQYEFRTKAVAKFNGVYYLSNVNFLEMIK